MKKRLVSLLLAFSIVLALVPTISFTASATTFVDRSNETPNYTTGVQSYSDLLSRLETLINKYNNTFWTSTGTACNGHGTGYTCYSKYYHGWQCKGFASYIFNDLFCGGWIGSTNSSNYYITSPVNATLVAQAVGVSTSDTATVSNVLSQARAGDFIQMRRRSSGGPHSMIVASVDSGGIWIFDCNSASVRCSVRKYYQTWAQFAAKNISFSLYRSTKYPNMNNIPVGEVESASGGVNKVTVKGWVYDKDDLNRNVEVHIYIGKTMIGGGVANEYRKDVNDAYGVGAYHGYTITCDVPAGLVGTKQIDVYAIDADAPNNPRLLHSGQEVVVNILDDTHNPVGVIEAVTGGVQCVNIEGWAYDIDDIGAELEIHAYIGGAAGIGEGFGNLFANKYRADVDSAYGVGRYHGYKETLYTKLTGTQPVYVYAINVGTGEHALLGTEMVTILPDTTGPVISNVKVTDIDFSGYTVTCTIKDDTEVTKVRFPTWTVPEQDDLGADWVEDTKYSGTNTGTEYTYRVSFLDHNNEKTGYLTHIYAWDAYGNVSCVGTKGSGYGLLAAQYVIEYNANGGVGAPSTQIKTHGTAVTLSSVKPTRSGYRFVGWNTSENGLGSDYHSGEQYTIDKSITLYAEWEAHKEVKQNEMNATCTEKGYTGDVVCYTCGELIASGNAIAALGHKYVENVCINCGNVDIIKLTAPTVKAATDPITGKVKLSWNAVEHATVYYIYRYSADKGGYYYYDKTTGTNYTNSSTTPGVTYYYKVKAVTTVDGYESSDTSDRVYVTRDCAKPTNVTLTRNSSGKPVLKWSAVSGANQYEVYRKVGENGTYTKYYTTTGTSLTNNSTEPGKTYYYKVVATQKNNSAATSAYSQEVGITAKCAKPSVSATTDAATGNIKLSWNKVSGATRYYIYRSTSKNGTYRYYDSTTGTSYTNSSTTPGVTYYYKVRAICGTSSYGNSEVSSYVYITRDCAAPTVTISRNSSGKPVLTWKKVDGASKYYIYRYDSASGAYKYYYTTTSTSFTNSSAVKGKTYYYKVKAICGTSSYGNSALSTAKSITAR